MLALAFAWKISSEALRPLAGEPMWEFIERGGSYAAPLALLVLSLRARGPSHRTVPRAIGVS